MIVVNTPPAAAVSKVDAGGIRASLGALSHYQRRLLVFLSVASFFEGYDFLALAQILPNLQQEMGLSSTGLGWMVGLINAGAFASWFVVRRCDHVGRRRLLNTTIAGYTVATVATAFTRSPAEFVIAQFFARLFLSAEAAICMVYAAEEYPARIRGLVIGLINAVITLGSVTCAALVPLLVATSLGWRAVYLIGAIPLVLIGFGRRSLRETQRFTVSPSPDAGMVAIWKSPYRMRLVVMAVVWALTVAALQSATTFWKQFAVTERGLSDSQVGITIAVAALGSIPLSIVAAGLLDAIGRRWSIALIYLCAIGGIAGAYSASGLLPLAVMVTLGIAGTASAYPALHALTAELFPTVLRGTAFAWAFNLLGRIGFVMSPIVVGGLAESYGWRVAVLAMLPLAVVALLLVVVCVPETARQELEDTSMLMRPPSEEPAAYNG